MNRTVKNYEIRRVLGEGAMGMVYYAIDLTLQREAALKSLRPDLAQQQKVIDRFRAEAQTQAKLNHQNIAHIYEYFQFRAEHFMAMEFINGKTLSVMLQERGRLPFEDASGYIVQALRGLAHAHRHRVIHRDVKPSNLMLNTDGVIKVTDFGIARVVGADRATRIGLLLGTYEYISPEAVEGKDTTELSDLYSTGIVLFELVTGQLPFTGDSEYDLVNKHVEAERPSLRDFGLRDVPSEFEGIIKRAMDRNPRKRFKSADEMADALQTCLDRHRQRAGGAPGGWRRWWGGPSSGAETTVTAAGTTATALPGRSDISTAIRRVEDLLERHLWEEADRVAEDCWRSHPNDPELADVRGRIQRQHQLYEQAIQQQVLLARDLLNRDLPEAALSVVKNALAQYPRASALLDVKRECSQRIELRRQRADEVAQIQKRVDELTAAGKYQEAADYVLERQEHSKHLGELALILGRVMQARKEYERNQAILQVLSEGRALAGRGSWQEALATLDQAIEKYARDSRLTGLRGDLQEEWRAEQIRQAVEELVAEASAVAESSPEDARQKIASGLDEFPENGRLKQELARLDGILEARRRKQSIAAAVDLASKLRRERKWQEAVTVLDTCRDRDGPDPKTDELHALLEAEYRAHQAILERWRAESRGLIESKAWEEAILKLSSAVREMPGERVLTEMLQEAHQALANKRREETVARIKSEAEAHIGAERFDTAIQSLLDAVSQYPEEPTLSAVLSQAVGARDTFIAQQKVRAALDAAAGHWERREYEPAIAALRRGLEQVRDSAELLGRLEEYEREWAAVRRRRELDEISGALEEGIRTGEFQAALQRAAEGAARYPGDRDVLELQARARAEQRRVEAGKALAEALVSGAELEKEESWAAAAEVYERALAGYPETESKLRFRLDDARARELAAKRTANLASVESRFHSSLNSGLPDEAEQVLNQAAAEFADEPSFKTWQKELAEARRMAARAAAIREAVAAAQAFIDQQKFDDAERILTTTEQERGADGSLSSVRAALLEARESYASALESALKGVGELIERRDFEAAIAAAEKEQARFPHEPRFQELARDAAERRDEENRQNHISQIRILLGSGALDHAEVLLRYARNNYPDDPAFQELDRGFAEARRLLDAREAFSRQRPEIEQLAQARKWARAKELVQPYLDIPQIQDEARRISARMDAEETDYAERTGNIDKQARELIGAERFEEAATLLEHASEEYPEVEGYGALLGQARSHIEIASAARLLDETEHAVRDLARQNQLAEALALLDRALAERPGEARLRDLRAVVVASIQEQDSIAALAAEVDRLAGQQRGADAERALIEGLRRFPKSVRLLDLRPVVDAARKAEWEREAREANRVRETAEIERMIGQRQLPAAAAALEALTQEYGAQASEELSKQLDLAQQAGERQVARFLAKADRLRGAKSWPQALALFQDLPSWMAADGRVADLRELVSREAAEAEEATRQAAATQAAAQERESIAAIADEVDRLAKQQRGADAERALNEGLRRFPSNVRLQEFHPLVDAARKAELEREGRKLNRVRQAAEIQQFIDRHRYRDAAAALEVLGRDYGAEAGAELAKKLELARKADEREITRFLAKVDRLRSGRAWSQALALFQDLPAWMAEDSRVAGRRELVSRAAEEEEEAAAAKQAAAVEAAAKEQEELDAIADEIELLAKQQRGADAERVLIGALRRFPRSGRLQELKPLIEAARKAEWEREVREVNRNREAAEIERLIERHELRSAAAALAALREEYGAEAGTELTQQLELAGKADEREVDLLLAKVDRLRSEKAWPRVLALFQDLPSWMAEDSRIADRRELVTHEAERSVARHLALGREKQQAGDSGAALAELERGLAAHPGEPRLLQFAASVRKTIEDLQRQRDEFIASCLDQASKLRDGGNLEAALAQVEQGLSSYPEAGNLREMETRLREALEISLSKRAGDVRACLAEAHELESGGQLDEALSRVENALSLYPGERELTQRQNRLQRTVQEARRKTDELVARVRDLEAAGDPEGALRCAEQALALYPNQPRLLQLSATTRNAIQEKARAREESIKWYGNQARKLRDAGDLESALEQVEQGLASYPQEARLKELEPLLIQEIEESRRKRDELVSRCTAEARKYQEAGDFGAALAKIEEGLAVYPDDARLLPIAANLRKTLQDIRRKRDEFIALCTARARELQETGNLQDALAEVERGLASYPGDNRLAQLRVVLKKAIDEALRRKEETIARLLKQAQALQQSGSLKGALAQIEQGLTAYPGEARLREMELALHEAVEERRRKRDEIVLGCLTQVRDLQTAGDLKNALARVREGLAACPDDSRLLEASARLQKLLADERRKREESIATCLAEGRQLQAAGDLEGAMNLVRQGLAAYPDDDRLRKLRDALQAALQESLQRRDEFVTRCTRETQELELAGDLKGALVQIDQALTFYPGDAKLVELHATLVQSYEEYRRNQDDLVIQSLMRARQLEAKGDLKSALEEIDRSLAAYPAEPRLVQARIALQARLQTVWYRRPVAYVPAALVIAVAAFVALFLPKAAIDAEHSPAVLAFPSYRIGSAVPPVSLEIVWQNPGIPFTTLVSDPWITVTPDKGQRLNRMEVSVNPAALRPGHLKGTVTVQPATNARVSGNLVVPVMIDVEAGTPPPPPTEGDTALKVDRSSLSFPYQMNGPLPEHAQVRAIQGHIGKCTPSVDWLRARQTGEVCDVWVEPGKRPAGSYTATLLLKGAAGNDVRVSASLNITAPSPPPPPPRKRIPRDAYYAIPEGECTWIVALAAGEEIRLDATGSKMLSPMKTGQAAPGCRPVPFVDLSSMDVGSSLPQVKADAQQDQIVVKNTGSTQVNQFTIRWRVKQ